MVSTHPTNSGRTFEIAILRSAPMHLHGWKAQWSHCLWCGLHTMFTARVQARAIAIRRTCICVAMLHGWAHRMATVTHPSSDQNSCSLTCVISKRSLCEHGYEFGTRLVVLFHASYIHVLNIFFTNAIFIFVNNQNWPWNNLFYKFCIF